MARNVDRPSAHTFSHQAGPCVHGIARLTPLVEVSLLVSTLSIFKPFARTCLYHSVHQDYDRNMNFSERMSPRGSREGAFWNGDPRKTLFANEKLGKATGGQKTAGDPAKTPIRTGIQKGPPETRGSRKGPRGIQDRPSTQALLYHRGAEDRPFA